MKHINREGILRMIGLRDTAGFLNKINAMYLDIYDEDGKLAEYSTQLIMTSKNITLLAQRVTDNEQDIADLTVTSKQIQASVSTLTDTVETQGDDISGLKTTTQTHTSQIGQLTVTSKQIQASVSTLTDTVETQGDDISGLKTTTQTHTSQIGQLTVTSKQIQASVSTLTDTVETQGDDISGLKTTTQTHTSQISSLKMTDTQIQASVSSLRTDVDTNTGNITRQSQQISTISQKADGISARVTAIEGDYVKEAEISLMVKKDGNGYISNASIKADNIDFTFTRATNFISGGQTVMSIDNVGNLRILGTLTAGCVIGNLNVDNSGNISGTGSVTTDNVVAGYKTQEITVPSTNNSVTDITCSAGLFVFLKGSTSVNTHFFRLPTLSDIRSVLGITSTNKFFSARMVILNQSEAYHCYLTYRDGYGATTNQPWKMTFDDTHRTGGDAVTQLAVGDYIEILLIYNPTKGEYRAYEVVHNN